MPVRCLLLALVALCLAPTAAQAAGTVDLIVRRDAGLSAAERADVRADAGVAYERRLRIAHTELVSVPADEAAEALRELQADPDVRWAMRDGLARATAQDTYWPLLWGLHNTGQSILNVSGTADADMDVPEAWAGATGAGVKVAVVDSGIQLDHPDLAGRLATNPAESGAGKETNGVDDDGNGLVDDWRGWDFIQDDNEPDDVRGHGTHVAGTIAAVNGNGAGITGVAYDAQVINLRALGNDGTGPWSGIAEAFDLAGDMDARIVNASLGGVGSIPAITQVFNSHPDTLFVVSAGNDEVNLETGTDYYPCEAPAANVICIGASDNSDALADFSNYGTTAVDVFAPGVSVVSTHLSSGYVYMNGTSMASPNVSGVAALLLARNPALTTAQLKQTLMSTVDAKPGLLSITGGRVNAADALASVTADRDGDGTVDGGDNCPDLASADQTDTDGDGDGDVCDGTPRGHDDDADGLPALDDGCPSQSGPAGNGGCPLPLSDRDGDGIADAGDHCPDAAGPPALGGCPAAPVDSDGDRIPDTIDGCPAEPGPYETDGCPEAARPTVSRVTVSLSPCTRRRGACARRVRVSARTAGAETLSVVVERRKGRRWVRQASAQGSAGAALRLPKALRAGRYRVTATATGAGGTSDALRRSFTVRR